MDPDDAPTGTICTVGHPAHRHHPLLQGAVMSEIWVIRITGGIVFVTGASIPVLAIFGPRGLGWVG